MTVTTLPHQRRRADSSTGQFTLTRISAAEAAAAMDVWEQLERRLGDTAIASSSLWTNVWLTHYGDLVSHEFLIGESDGQPRGVCLLVRGVGESIGGLRVRSLHLGTAGEPDADSVCVEYNGLLVEETFRAEFSRQIVNTIASDPDWDQFQLDGFTEEQASAILPHIPAVDVRRRRSRFFDLRAAREQGTEILAALGRSTRSNIRRRLRDYGELTVEWVDSLTQAEAVFTELVRLHQARWLSVGRPGAFASRRFHNFQTELMVRGLNDRRVVLFRVRRGHETIGCLLLLADRNRLLDYLSGFASFQQHASPGLIVHFLCMQEALRRGYDAYDFLVGEHQHKRNLSIAANELIWATWRRDRLKFRAAAIARRVRTAIRSWRRGSTERPRGDNDASSTS